RSGPSKTFPLANGLPTVRCQVSLLVNRCDPHADSRHSRRSVQILRRPVQRLGIVPEMPQDVFVTLRTKKSPDDTRRVAVIHREPFTLTVGSSADVADPALELVDRPVLFGGDPVGIHQPGLPRVRTA